MKKVFAIAAVVAVFLITSSVIFAGGGGLENFLARFNANFGEFAIPPLYPAYAVDQDIRVEVVGAQQIDHIILAYVSVQDISGENRLSTDTNPSFAIFIDGEPVGRGGMTSQRLNFDAETNTTYHEMRLQGDPGMPLAESIELVMLRVEYFGHYTGQILPLIEGDWRMTVNTSDLGIRPIVWRDVSAGESLHIDFMSLSPFGVYLEGNHEYGSDFPWFDIRIEYEGRLFNRPILGGGGGIGPDCFSWFASPNRPIDIDDVAAVIVNGERIAVPIQP